MTIHVLDVSFAKKHS